VTTRDEVLAALRSAGDAGVSGEALARRLGVSRVAVGKHVAALRAAGYDIGACPGTGYLLRATPDAPLPAEVVPLLRTDGPAAGFWVRLEGGDETGSTNDDARGLARAGAPEGTVVLASRQRSGRGRLGRQWSSPSGGAYLSAIVRPNVVPADVASLALAAGVGIARGLASLGVCDARLKWPNDVLLAEGKLAGVLLEMAAETDRVEWVVVGIGLNVRPPADGARAMGAAYLADRVPGVLVAPTVAAVLDGLADAYLQWRDGGFSALRAEYEAALTLTGQPVGVRDVAGRLLAEGTVRGVDGEGRLLLTGADGSELAVASGEVTLRPPA